MKIDINITRQQREFLQSTKRGTVFLGGIGSGKSFILCMWAILRAMQGRRVGIVSFSYPTLRDTVLHTISELLFETFNLEHNKDFYINESKMKVKILDGEILLRSGDNPDSLRGLNLNDFAIDEAREFKDNKVFNIMLGRIRKTEDAQWIIATTTKGKNWVWALDREKNLFVSQTTMENPFLPKSFIEDVLASYTSDYARQELYAEIVEFGAGIIKPQWFKIQDIYEPSTKKCRFWDLAVSEKTSADRSSGALCSIEDNNFSIRNIKAGRWNYPDLRKIIIETALKDGTDVIIGIEEAGQQAGFIADLRNIPELRRYTIRAERPKGDKYNRAMLWACRAESGLVRVQRDSWNSEFMEECGNFTADDSHQHDDMIDSVSGAWAILCDEKKVSFGKYHI